MFNGIVLLCRLQCCGLHVLTSRASATQAQSEDAHGDYTAAFSAVDVGVIGEDVGDWLRGVGSERHCGCGCGGEKMLIRGCGLF